MISSQYTDPLKTQLSLKLVLFLAQNQPSAWVYRIQSQSRQQQLRTWSRWFRRRHTKSTMTIEFQFCQRRNVGTCKFSSRAWSPRNSLMFLETHRRAAQNKKCLTAPNRQTAHPDHANSSHQSFSMWTLTAQLPPTIISEESGHRSMWTRPVTRLPSPNNLAFK